MAHRPDPKSEFARYQKYYRSLEPILDKPRNRAYTATIFSFLAISLFGWYGIRPTIQTILFLRREIRDNTEVSKQMEKKIINLIQAQSTYQQLTPKFPLIKQALPENPDVVPLVFQLRNLASSVGASVAAISVPSTPLLNEQATSSAQREQAPNPEPVQLVIAVTGPYNNIQRFLQGVLSMRRIVSVNSISIGKAQNAEFQEGPANLRLVLRASTYFMSSNE